MVGRGEYLLLETLIEKNIFFYKGYSTKYLYFYAQAYYTCEKVFFASFKYFVYIKHIVFRYNNTRKMLTSFHFRPICKTNLQ